MRKHIPLASSSTRPEALLDADIPLLRSIAGARMGFVQAALSPYALSHLVRLGFIEIRAGRAHATGAGRTRLTRI